LHEIEQDIMDTPFNANAVANGVFQKRRVPKSKERISGNPGAWSALPLFDWNGRAQCPLETGAKRLIAMTQLEEAVARLTLARSMLAPITERILDIETRLAVAKAADIERLAKVLLREFTSNLLDQKQPRSPWTMMIEKYGMAVR
jgi:hypothetical protein